MEREEPITIDEEIFRRIQKLSKGSSTLPTGRVRTGNANGPPLELTSGTERRLRRWLRRHIRSGLFRWTMTTQALLELSDCPSDEVKRGSADTRAVLDLVDEEFRLSHKRMLPEEFCSYVIVGCEDRLVYGWWSSIAGAEPDGIRQVAERKIGMMDPSGFRKFHGCKPEIRYGAEFDIYRLPPDFKHADARSPYIRQRGHKAVSAIYRPVAGIRSRPISRKGG